MRETWSRPAVNVSSTNHFPSLRLSFLFRIASARVPTTLLVLGPLATREQPRCPWPPGGERDQSRDTDNVATCWWILGEREQLDVERREKLEMQQAQGSLEDLLQTPTKVASRGRAVPSRALLGAGKVHEYPAGALEGAIVSDPTL